MFWQVDPRRELERIRRDMDNLFDTNTRTVSRGYPPINVYDTGNDIKLHAELPGITKDDINLSFTDGNLTLSGKRKPLVEDEKYTIIRNERSTGEFEKTVNIPYPVVQDKISADFKNGVLTITLPKAEEAKPKKIEVNIS
ncbi:MAG: Hsp20/alpha crystallin family protein [Fibrobacteria bacterium]|nr:Hsp20/alpha crystallin family protein [Fibrobacteria bacterium]